MSPIHNILFPTLVVVICSPVRKLQAWLKECQRPDKAVRFERLRRDLEQELELLCGKAGQRRGRAWHLGRGWRLRRSKQKER
jgi:hypothetical protein